MKRAFHYVLCDIFVRRVSLRFMYIRNNIVWWLLCCGVCLAGMLGCHQFDTDEYAPVFPAANDASRFSNFQAGELASEAFEWSLGQTEFCLNIPEAGDYLLTYITVKGGDPSLVTSPAAQPPLSFAIALRASAPAYVSVGLQEDESLESFVLQRGAIKHEAVGLYDDGPIIRYASPSIPTIFWKDVFTLAPGSQPLVLERGLLPCPPQVFSGLELR